METEYYGRLSRVVVDLYPIIYRDYLQKQLSPEMCQDIANKIRKLRPTQLDVITDVKTRKKYDECDMPLVYELVSSPFAKLESPTAGWGVSPITGTGIADDIERIMSAFRITLASLPGEAISKEDYDEFIVETREICRRLDNKTFNARYVEKTISSTYEKRFDELQEQSMDGSQYKSYIEQIKDIQQKGKRNREGKGTFR